MKCKRWEYTNIYECKRIFPCDNHPEPCCECDEYPCIDRVCPFEQEGGES